ncbi:hypothetical protein [Brevibacterium gallinarum]|uniref:Uncharacterized protein n=1 Tax=Brevibacterium gallinarum TaxID=2762220 RepID=A0ABR8WQJ0_9MICO|nr:hypothetical protein [Brevibacterium gallinarum]MBD8019351.1 hypothetical protein [Brevibacterium gallinarum]
MSAPSINPNIGTLNGDSSVEFSIDDRDGHIGVVMTASATGQQLFVPVGEVWNVSAVLKSIARVCSDLDTLGLSLAVVELPGDLSDRGGDLRQGRGDLGDRTLQVVPVGERTSSFSGKLGRVGVVGSAAVTHDSSPSVGECVGDPQPTEGGARKGFTVLNADEFEQLREWLRKRRQQGGEQ